MFTTKNTIDGVWMNDNKNARSTTKIIISSNGKNVQVFDTCGSNDYDRGTKILTPETNSTDMYWAIFNNSFSKSIFIFTINNNKMEARYEQDYKSSSRETKRFVENFTKLDIYVHEPTVASIATENTISSIIKQENIALQEPDNTSVLFLDDFVMETPYETTNVRMDMYPVKGFESRFSSYLPSTFHLRYKEGKSYGLHKGLLNVFIFIRTILNKVRNTVSIRRLMSLKGITTQHSNVF